MCLKREKGTNDFAPYLFYQYGTLRAGVLLALARFIIEITTKIITQVYVSVSNLINRNYHLSNFSLNNAHRVKRDN